MKRLYVFILSGIVGCFPEFALAEKHESDIAIEELRSLYHITIVSCQVRSNKEAKLIELSVNGAKAETYRCVDLQIKDVLWKSPSSDYSVANREYRPFIVAGRTTPVFDSLISGGGDEQYYLHTGKVIDTEEIVYLVLARSVLARTSKGFVIVHSPSAEDATKFCSANQ
jgi:hypothetical protein